MPTGIFKACGDVLRIFSPPPHWARGGASCPVSAGLSFTIGLRGKAASEPPFDGSWDWVAHNEFDPPPDQHPQEGWREEITFSRVAPERGKQPFIKDRQHMRVAQPLSDIREIGAVQVFQGVQKHLPVLLAFGALRAIRIHRLTEDGSRIGQVTKSVASGECPNCEMIAVPAEACGKPADAPHAPHLKKALKSAT